MSPPSRREAPGIARAERGESAPFEAMLRHAAEDPAAAEAFVLAWAALGRLERRALVDAIGADARRSRVDVGRLLGVLRAVETDRWVFEGALGSAFEGIEGAVERLVLVQGAQALEVRVTSPGFDAAHTSPDASRIEVHHHPEWSNDRALRAADLPATVDRVAALLWQHRREGGDLPGALGSFATLFDR